VTPEQIRLALEEENIESRPIWKPMHMQPVFEKNDFIKLQDAAVSEDIFENGLCLPSDIKNTSDDMERIISIIKTMF
ncbi:MAG: DegT/DnrJ/EryC1/StrS family aminotransferase, partial [Oscillospiraceae bacterium]|nr:DegT/DnrJ/EryC1/StrS family aminotransferase [Oscillospiraceae bacterium]